MTDYYYQAEDDDPAAGPAVGDNRRPRFADQYPADSGFLPDHYRDARREDDGYADDPAGAYPEDATYAGDGYAGDGYAEDGHAAPAAPYDSPPATVASGDTGDWPADPADPYDPDAYDPDAAPADDDAYYAADAGALPVAAAPRRVTIAETGAASARRIRFDPTQERGPEFYTRAGRHSRLVRRLKIALPAIAGLGVVGFVAFVQFAPGPDTAIIKLSGINVESKSVTMDKPHISGFEGTRRAYEVGADRAVQDLANPKVVTLDNINARLGIDDGDTAHIVATKGDYNGDTNKLVLSGGITIETTTGYKAALEEADIDIKSGTMTSSRPLEIVTDTATVKANAVEVQDEGKHIWFRNGVTVVYTPPDEPADGPAEGAAAAGPVDAGEPATTTEGGSS